MTDDAGVSFIVRAGESDECESADEAYRSSDAPSSAGVRYELCELACDLAVPLDAYFSGEGDCEREMDGDSGGSLPSEWRFCVAPLRDIDDDGEGEPAAVPTIFWYRSKKGSLDPLLEDVLDGERATSSPGEDGRDDGDDGPRKPGTRHVMSPRRKQQEQRAGGGSNLPGLGSGDRDLAPYAASLGTAGSMSSRISGRRLRRSASLSSMLGGTTSPPPALAPQMCSPSSNSSTQLPQSEHLIELACEGSTGAAVGGAHRLVVTGADPCREGLSRGAEPGW